MKKAGCMLIMLALALIVFGLGKENIPGNLVTDSKSLAWFNWLWPTGIVITLALLLIRELKSTSK